MKLELPAGENTRQCRHGHSNGHHDALPHTERNELMGGHARVGRKWAGKILQLITGCTGLDDWEWGVTLLAHDAMDLKGIAYEMRFDEVTMDKPKTRH